jgi:replication-associated recombination protein RarA
MPTPLLSNFTPSLMSPETLEKIFVQREEIAQDLVDRIILSATTPAKHHSLLIGARGMGKTHLVSLVYYVSIVFARASVLYDFGDDTSFICWCTKAFP